MIKTGLLVFLPILLSRLRITLRLARLHRSHSSWTGHVALCRILLSIILLAVGGRGRCSRGIEVVLLGGVARRRARPRGAAAAC